MKIIIDIPDDFVPEDGDAFEAVRSALEHFEIPSRMNVLPENLSECHATQNQLPERNKINAIAAAAFVQRTSLMSTVRRVSTANFTSYWSSFVPVRAMPERRSCSRLPLDR